MKRYGSRQLGRERTPEFWNRELAGPRRSIVSEPKHCVVGGARFGLAHAVKVNGGYGNCKNCALIDAPVTAGDRKGRAALDLAKLKAFLDKDAAMNWPETATTGTERAERVWERRSQNCHASRVTTSPNLFNHRPTSCHNRVSCRPHTMVTGTSSSSPRHF